MLVGEPNTSVFPTAAQLQSIGINVSRKYDEMLKILDGIVNGNPAGIVIDDKVPRVKITDKVTCSNIMPFSYGNEDNLI